MAHIKPCQDSEGGLHQLTAPSGALSTKCGSALNLEPFRLLQDVGFRVSVVRVQGL